MVQLRIMHTDADRVAEVIPAPQRRPRRVHTERVDDRQAPARRRTGARRALPPGTGEVGEHR